MFTNSESGGASPRGSLTTDSTSCAYEHCFWAAEVVLAGSTQNELRVCQFHWRELTRSALGPVKPIRVLNRPDCFRPDCEDRAVAIIRNVDATIRPVCQQHLDDLSWVDVPEFSTTRGSRALHVGTEF